MIKKLLAISMLSISVTEVVAMTVEHGLFGKLEVVDHKDDIRAYNNWCLSQKQSIDDTDFLAKSCAEKCFKFDESTPEISYSKTEAEDLLKSISKNPVAAGAMKVLVSKYNKYDEKILPKCGVTKDLKEESCYTHDYEEIPTFISEHHINVCPNVKKLFFFDLEKQTSQEYEPSIKRILTHELMHFMDSVTNCRCNYSSDNLSVWETKFKFLDAETLKRHTPDYSSKIDDAKDLLDRIGLKLENALQYVYDDTIEAYGMYGLLVHHFKKKYYFSSNTKIECNFKLAYEPINDAMSYLHGFGEEVDDIVGKIRTGHKAGLAKYPGVISTLEDNFHIYSFYKQPDVQEAFEFSTKVVEEA